MCTLAENKVEFRKCEGLNLIQIMIRNAKFVRKCALKLLDYVCQDDVESCRDFVELPGLGVLFAAFMRLGAKKKKKGFSEDDDDNHCVSIIYSMLSLLGGEKSSTTTSSNSSSSSNEAVNGERDRLRECYQRVVL